jgi:hypothetical protein
VALVVIGIHGVAGLVLLLWVERGADERSWPAWERLEAALAADAAWLRGSFARRLAVIAAFLEAIEGELADGRRDEAALLLVQSRARVDEHARHARESLREWNEEARALAALVPLPPLAPGRLRLGRLRALALGWHLCHLVAVTSRERYLLRLFVLRRSFMSLARWWRRVRLPRSAPRPWTQGRTLHADLRTLGEACADSYEALLVSRRTAAAARPDTRSVRSPSA